MYGRTGERQGAAGHQRVLELRGCRLCNEVGGLNSMKRPVSQACGCQEKSQAARPPLIIVFFFLFGLYGFASVGYLMTYMF